MAMTMQLLGSYNPMQLSSIYSYLGGGKPDGENGHKSDRHIFLLVMPLMEYSESIIHNAS